LMRTSFVRILAAEHQVALAVVFSWNSGHVESATIRNQT